MNISDAAKVLGLSGELTKAVVKKAYRVASSRFHPDKGGSVQMMQAVNEAYEVLKSFEGDSKVGEESARYGEELNDAINRVINLEGIIVEVCGAWVWLTGNTKPHAKALGKNGAKFFYASKKQAWYYRPAEWKSKGRGSFSMEDIRGRHGSVSVNSPSVRQVDLGA